MAGAVAVFVGGGRGQADAVGGQGDGVVGIAAIAMLDRTRLIQGDHATRAHADGEHGRAAGRGFTDDVAGGVHAHGHGFAGGGVHQAAGGGHDFKCVRGAARAVGTVVDAEDVGEAGRGVGRQGGFVYGQGRGVGGGRSHGRCVVFHSYFEFRR